MLRLNALLAFVSTALLSALLVGPLVGDTNPPAGPVSGTMKPLSQVEPRTPVENLPGSANSVRVISQAGSYYLTENLMGLPGIVFGIEIAANNVTLDLNGFSVVGDPTSGIGVAVNGTFTNIVIKNGTVSGWPALGISASAGRNTQVLNVCVEACGTGLQAGQNSLIRDCNFRGNSNSGLSLSSAATVVNCSASFNLNGFVSSGGQAVQILESVAYNNTSFGIFCSAGLGGVIRNCVVTNNAGGGITASTGFLISGNNCINNGAVGGAGIHMNGSDSRIVDNNVQGAARGFDIDGPGNFVAGNTASGNTVNYDIATTQTIGPIITTTGTITTTNPWANFEY